MTYDELVEIVNTAQKAYSANIEMSQRIESNYRANPTPENSRLFNEAMAQTKVSEANYLALNKQLFDLARAASTGTPLPSSIKPINLIPDITDTMSTSEKDALVNSAKNVVYTVTGAKNITSTSNDSLTTTTINGKKYPSLWVWLGAGALVYFLLRRKRA